MCSHTGVLSLSVCFHTRCALIQSVLSYRLFSHTLCALIQGVLSYSMCCHTGVLSCIVRFHTRCALIQSMFLYRLSTHGVCSLIQACCGVKCNVERNCSKKYRTSCVPVHGRQRITSPLSIVQLDMLLSYIDHIMVSVNFDPRSVNAYRHNGHYMCPTCCSLPTQCIDERRTAWGIKGNFVSKQH
jgi:hypothetical protein